MKLIKINQTKVSDVRQVPGLLDCRMEYEVKSAKGRLDYAGPKFTLETWQPVLSFFRWTYEEMQSESQVRLYVNPKLGRWAAWAFPQEARTGMNARELPVTESAVQAQERFASWQSEPSDDWLYFGTAHHHCSASAFQSSTDEQNEWNQDGLHLTVGRMDADQYELHARFYVGGICFEPDLGLFWTLEADLAAKVPSALHGELARHQMGEKVTVDFPDAWKTNVVELEQRRARSRPERGRAADLALEMPWHIRLDEALEEIHSMCVSGLVGEEDWRQELSALAASEVSQLILEVCIKHGVTPDQLLAGLTQDARDFETA